MEMLQEKIIVIGSLVIVPHPNEDDSWKSEIITVVEDIDNNGFAYFSDDDWDNHKIELERLTLI